MKVECHSPLNVKENECHVNKIISTEYNVQQQGDMSVDFPSPFKKALFWPQPCKKDGKKHRSKEKVPSVVTSQQWRQYHMSKERKIQKQESAAKKRQEMAEQKKKRRQAAKERRNKVAGKKLIEELEKEAKRKNKLEIKSDKPKRKALDDIKLEI